MISFGIIFVGLYVLSMGIAFFSRRKIEYGFPFAITMIITIIYIFALFGVMVIGLFIVYLLVFIAFFYCIYYMIKYKPKIFTEIITPATLVYIVIFIIILLGHKGRFIYHTDPMGQWAIAVKAMFRTNEVPNAINSSLTTLKTPHAVGIFQYAWCKIYGIYSEVSLYRAINILCLSLIFPIFSEITWKKSWHLLWVLPTTLFGLAIYDNNIYTSLQVDSFLGIACGYILVLYFFSEKKMYDVLALALATFVVTLTKATSLVPLLATVIVIFLDIFHKKIISKKVENKKTLKISIRMMIVLIAVAGITYVSWLMYTSQDVFENQFDAKITFESEYNKSDKVDLAETEQTLYCNKFTKKFITVTKASLFKLIYMDKQGQIFASDLRGKSSVFTYQSILLEIIIFALLSCLISKKSKFIVIFSFVGFIAYFIGRMLIYVLVHGPDVINNASSFDRYISVYAIAFFIICFYSIADTFITRENTIFYPSSTKNAILIRLFFVLVLLFTNYKALKDITLDKKESVEFHYMFTELYRNTRGIAQIIDFDMNANIYYIASDEDISYLAKNSYVYARYVNEPLRIAMSSTYPKGGNNRYPYCISSDAVRNEEERNNKYTYYSVKTWEDILHKGFDYVYIYSADEYFINDYGILFEDIKDIGRFTMFKVNIDNGYVVLTKLDDDK